MKILLTGAFGNIGGSTLVALQEKNYEIKCFDIKNKTNQKKQKVFMSEFGEFDTIWGDITSIESLKEVVHDVDCIIHLSAIIPPMSEIQPDVAKKINVHGTRNILELANHIDPKPKLIFPSSVSTHGPRNPDSFPIRADDLLSPSDNYTHHKVKCEKMIKESELPWTILRVAASPSLVITSKLDPFLFEIPWNQKVEFVHSGDVGRACANSVEANTEQKVLLIGGGKKCQMIYGDFVNGVTESMGIGKFPSTAFRIPRSNNDWYYTDWMDTNKSQSLLNYQTLTYEDYLNELKKHLGVKQYIIKLFGPLIRRQILKHSAYY